MGVEVNENRKKSRLTVWASILLTVICILLNFDQYETARDATLMNFFTTVIYLVGWYIIIRFERKNEDVQIIDMFRYFWMATIVLVILLPVLSTVGAGLGLIALPFVLTLLPQLYGLSYIFGDGFFFALAIIVIAVTFIRISRKNSEETDDEGIEIEF